jgi:D-alanyl-D-alanine carboxypeptidase (penicillin-binding protein 5/6)
MNNAAFLNAMNADATALGLSQTHYADYTGISTGDLSTAQDVATLTVDLMTSQPFIDSIVSLTKVHLPVAGWVGSYTPYIGSDGVVGVKSGYTLASGGCVAMAINVTIGGVVVPTYEVVLSQPGANALDVAGAHALQLMRALRPSLTLVRVAEVKTVAWIGSPSLVTPTTTTTTTTTTSSTTTTIPTI